MEPIIRVSGLKKYFKEIKAVDDISFQVEKGELFGFLGVNGAGKSTTINMMCTLYEPTAGTIEICGCPMAAQAEEIRNHIGVVWQHNCLDGKLSVRENLFVRGAMYGIKGNDLKRCVHAVCEKLKLGDIYQRKYEKLSGGQKRRCEIAAALVHAPELLILDEPTTGLDPATRKLVWESIETLRSEEHMTVFLTTHYMEEAARAAHIAVIDSGKIKEFGTPFEIKQRYTKDRLRLLPKQTKEKLFEEKLQEMERKNPKISCSRSEGSYLLFMSDSMDALPILKNLEHELEGFELVQGTMDDAFLEITGRECEKNF